MEFTGFDPQSYAFLLSLAINNSKEYFLQEKQTYETYVRAPMLALDEALTPAVLEIDDRLQTGKSALSRMYRDTRFAKNKDPMHDYSWLMYKQRGTLKSEYFGLYVSITPVSFSYGLGCYAPRPACMEALYEKMLDLPDTFKRIVQAQALQRFEISGDAFKRPKRSCADETINRFLQMKYFYLEFHSSALQTTYSPEFANEVADAFYALAPLYRFIHS